MAAVNLTCALLDETIETIERAGESASVVPALREPKRVFTYERLLREVCQVAGALRRQGLGAGERVVLFMHDGAEMAAALLGTLRAGLCAVPVVDTLRPKEMLNVLRDCGARAVIAHADLAEQVSLLQSAAPALQWVLSLGGTGPGQVDFAALCFDADPHCEAAAVKEPAPAFLLYETGPDGRLHGYAHGHRTPLTAHHSYAQGVLGLRREDRVFCTARLASRFGLGLGLFFPLRAGGASFLLPDQARCRAVFDVLGSFRPTVFGATPSLYNQLVQEYLEMSVPRPMYFQGVRLSVSGMEALPPALERRLRGVFQIQPLHSFSTAESFHALLSNRVGASRPGSCGQPVPGIAVRVVDNEGAEAGVAEIGRLEVQGDLLGTPWVAGVAEPGGGGWVRTPERFFMDQDGYLFHAGRADDMFRVAGELVSPADVEQTLLGHPSVWECAVTEELDEDGMTLPKAYVVLNVGREPSMQLARELMDFVRRQLSPHKYPRAVEFLHKLPRGADGRVARWRLRTRQGPLTPPSGSTPVR